MISVPLTLLLAAVFALSPLAIDTYLPAIPAMAGDLALNAEDVAITVSMYIFGMAVGQAVGGPASDRIGRRPVMIAGLFVFALGSVMLASVDGRDGLWGWRLLQALGGGIAVVGVPAVIRDRSTGAEAARLFALIALIMGIAPALAPALGTVIMNLAGWRTIFVVLAAAAFLLIVPVFLGISGGGRGRSQVSRNVFVEVASNRACLGYLLSIAFSFSAMMVFLTNAPFIYLEHHRIGEEAFSIVFIFNVAFIMIVNRINDRLLRRHAPEDLLKVWGLMQLAGGVCVLLANAILPESPLALIIAFVVLLAPNGGIMSNANACFLSYFGANAGAASAVMGTTQFLVGAGVSAFSAMLRAGRLWPALMVVSLCAAISALGTILRAVTRKPVVSTPSA